MSVIATILRQLHVFLAGFAISAACLLLAGMVSDYPGGSSGNVSGEKGNALVVAADD